MKPHISTIAVVLLPALVSLHAVAQSTPASARQRARRGPPAASGINTPGADRLKPTELEELLWPIALYPDNLPANVLAASVYPDEVFAAGKFVAAGGKKEQIAAPSRAPAPSSKPRRSSGPAKPTARTATPTD